MAIRCSKENNKPTDTATHQYLYDFNDRRPYATGVQDQFLYFQTGMGLPQKASQDVHNGKQKRYPADKVGGSGSLQQIKS